MTSPTPAAGGRAPGGEWPAQVAGRIEAVVGTVRDKTTVPATFAARAVVYGMVLGVLGAILAILVVLGLTRLLDVYLGLHPYGRRVWIVDAGASAIFLLAGMFFWRKRRPSRH